MHQFKVDLPLIDAVIHLLLLTLYVTCPSNIARMRDSNPRPVLGFCAHLIGNAQVVSNDPPEVQVTVKIHLAGAKLKNILIQTYRIPG